MIIKRTARLSISHRYRFSSNIATNILIKFIIILLLAFYLGFFYRRCSCYFQFLNGSFTPRFFLLFFKRPTISHVVTLDPHFIPLTGSIIAQDWLPVGIRSWTPVYIEWSRSSRAGLNFHAAYKFINDTYCGDHTTAEPEGEVNGGDLASAGLKLNQYYQQKCTWILDSPIDRQLVIEVKSIQSRELICIYISSQKLFQQKRFVSIQLANI